jgi:hypothetical protein
VFYVARLARFFLPQHTKTVKIIPNNKNIPNGHKNDSIFHSKALQNYPNWDFWFENKPSGNPGSSATNQKLKIS